MPKGVYERSKIFLREQRERLKKNPPALGKHWKLSKNTKEKMSLSKIGHIGVKHTLETKNKLRKANLGKNSNTWKGGISRGTNKKEYYRFKCLERVAKKKNAQGTHTLKEWQDLKSFYDLMCLCCKKREPEIKLTEDHIIPLSKDGSDNIENIQPLCGSCNSIKNAKIIKY